MSITMYRLKTNEDGELLENEYLIPMKALKKFLKTESEQVVQDYLCDYITEDTESVLDFCIAERISYEVVKDEINGEFF